MKGLWVIISRNERVKEKLRESVYSFKEARRETNIKQTHKTIGAGSWKKGAWAKDFR